MKLPFSFLNSKLISFLEKENTSLNLTEGKLGFCIYFYYLGSVYNNKKYKQIATRLLDHIFESIDILESIDVKNGLAGIGLGVDYLIKNNYVKGNINVILNDIDDVIFKNLTCSKHYEKLDTLSLIHILYYLCIRLKSQKQGSENEYLFKELIIQTVNNLYERVDLSFYEEPIVYNIDYPLAQLLFVINEIYILDFYNYRLIKIIEELSHKVLSIIPLLHCNKLYLLAGMVALQKQIQDKNWEKHIHLLINEIDMNILLDQELRDRNIFFNNGYPSICLLAIYLKEYISKEYIKKALQKIEESTMWNLLLQEPSYFNIHKGLYKGFPGTILFMELMKNNYI